MFAERGNYTAACTIELLGKFVKFSVGRAGEKRGDVGLFCGNYCLIISMPRKYKPVQDSSNYRDMTLHLRFL